MYDFDDAPVGVNHSELAEEAVELVNHLRVLSRPETRELLDRHRHDGETFRSHQIDGDSRSVLGQLRANYLVEPADIESGNVKDWTPTERCDEMIDVVDEHSVYVVDSEADALLQIGARVWMLPEPGVWWTTSDIDVDIHPQELSTLESAGLARRAIDTRSGYATIWRTSTRLHDIATVVWEVLSDE